MSESRLRWLLVVSFGLNLFLLGIMAARVATMVGMHRHHHEMMMMRGPMGDGPFAEGMGGPHDRLPEADRAILRQALEPLKPSDGDRKAMQERHEQLQKLMQADSFDANAFKALLRQGGEDRAKHAQQRQDALADALAKMSPEGRKALSEGPRMQLLLGGGHPGMMMQQHRMLMRHHAGDPDMMREGMAEQPGAIPLDRDTAPVAAPPPAKL
jgi:uncharacterized membrane protein